MRNVLLALSVLLASSGSAVAQSDDAQPPGSLVQIAQNQAASLLGTTADRLTLTASFSTEWPDSSLGCPQPGMAYSQIVTPGWVLTFDTDDGATELDVHTDDGSRAVIC